MSEDVGMSFDPQSIRRQAERMNRAAAIGEELLQRYGWDVLYAPKFGKLNFFADCYENETAAMLEAAGVERREVEVCPNGEEVFEPVEIPEVAGQHLQVEINLFAARAKRIKENPHKYRMPVAVDEAMFDENIADFQRAKAIFLHLRSNNWRVVHHFASGKILALCQCSKAEACDVLASAGVDPNDVVFHRVEPSAQATT